MPLFLCFVLCVYHVLTMIATWSLLFMYRALTMVATWSVLFRLSSEYVIGPVPIWLSVQCESSLIRNCFLLQNVRLQ